jgi:hypothetical protein
MTKVKNGKSRDGDASEDERTSREELFLLTYFLLTFGID